MLFSQPFLVSLALLATAVQTQSNFVIGAALCSTLSGSSSTDRIFLTKGQTEAGYVEYDNSNTISNPLSRQTALHPPRVRHGPELLCQGGNWDFYKKNGDGTLLGTRYGYTGKSHFCLQPFGAGSCSVRTGFRCNRSGFGAGPC